jgi:hypothetical protein
MSPSGRQPRSRLLTDAALEAVQVALEALEERASTTRLLLEDPTLHGLVPRTRRTATSSATVPRPRCSTRRCRPHAVRPSSKASPPAAPRGLRRSPSSAGSSWWAAPSAASDSSDIKRGEVAIAIAIAASVASLMLLG